MPTTGDLTLELLDGNELDATVTSQRKVTPFLISGLAVDSDPDPDVTWNAKQLLADNGYTLGSNLSGRTNMILSRIVVRGYTNDGVVGFMVHQSPSFDILSVSLIRRRSYMAGRSSNTFIDSTGKRRAIKVAAVTDSATGETFKEDYVTIDYPQPMQALQTYTLRFGQPPPPNQVFGRVNDGPWNGLPTGYWLMNEYETDQSVYAGYYTVTATAISQVVSPWMFAGILRSQKTGKYYPTTDPDIASTVAAYVNDLVAVPGAVGVGPYRTSAAFPSTFGIN
jgi:hypothetical protein